MASGIPDIELGTNWPQEEMSEVYAIRERMLVNAYTDPGFITIEDLRDDTVKLIAGLSLFQEGHFILDSEMPDRMRLTESGRKLAIGYTALKNS